MVYYSLSQRDGYQGLLITAGLGLEETREPTSPSPAFFEGQEGDSGNSTYTNSLTDFFPRQDYMRPIDRFPACAVLFFLLAHIAKGGKCDAHDREQCQRGFSSTSGSNLNLHVHSVRH